MLRELQLVLAGLGKDQRRNSAEFKEIMEIYKSLGTDLHEARKNVPPPAPTARPAQPLSPRSPLGPAPGTSPAPGLAPFAPSVSALSRAAQAYGRTTGPLPTRSSGTGPMVPTAETPSASSLLPVTPEESQAPLEAVASLSPSPLVEAALSESVHVQAAPAAAGLPLEMPRFISTLGPAGSRAISKGPEVQRLQQLLAVLGYDVPPTDSFDVKTFRAVQEFQKVHKIPVTGLVGVETRRLLNEKVTG